MSGQIAPSAEIWTLFDAACADQLGVDQVERLDAALRDDAQLRDLYLDYFRLHAELLRSVRLETARGKIVATIKQPRPAPALPPIIIDLSSPLSPLSVGGPVFSYIAATLILGVMLLSAWAYKITHNYDPAIVQNSRRSTTSGRTVQQRPDPVFVARVTGMNDCRWADPQTETYAGAAVPLGRKYALSSGLMEITYRSGAKVILEGPCHYEVESSAGGFLSLGKLTAKVESGECRVESGGKWPVAGTGKASGTRLSANRQIPKSPNPQIHSPLSTLHSPLFSVRTPTAVVTDLGTEFGVYVDPAGSCQAYVYRGKVELRVSNGDKGGDLTIQLGENEFARTIQGKDNVVTAVREPGQPNIFRFIRRMPKKVKIDLFNTGVGLQEGDEDPHWQLTARSDDLNFKPRPAVVTKVYEHFCLVNDPAQSQWISAVADLSPVPDNVVYTFRTTFDLKGTSPDSAVIHGRFLADDHVRAIRLNGRGVKVPDHPWGWPFDRWAHFTMSEGFVKGTNVLEVDLLNQDPTADSTNAQAEGSMVLRVELWGAVLCVPPTTTEETCAGKEVTP